MALTEARKELRAKHITATDMTAILGLSPWRTGADVFLDKTGQLDETPENEAMHRGSRLEVALLDEAEERLGAIRRNAFRVCSDCSVLSATLDAVVNETGDVVECKTVGANMEAWGAPGTDEVPEMVIVQTHVQMLCAEAKQAHVVALLGGFKGLAIEFYLVPFNEALAAVIKERAVKFWRDHVEAGVPPTDCVPSIEVLKLLRRQPAKVVQFGEAEAALVKQYQEFGAAESLAKKLKEGVKAQVINALGDAEGAEFAGGVVTYMAHPVKAFTVAASVRRELRIKGVKQ